jgi:hypothetical protein
MDDKLEHTLHVNGRDAWYDKQSACDGWPKTDADNEHQKGKKEACPTPQRKQIVSHPKSKNSNTGINFQID